MNIAAIFGASGVTLGAFGKNPGWLVGWLLCSLVAPLSPSPYLYVNLLSSILTLDLCYLLSL